MGTALLVGVAAVVLSACASAAPSAVRSTTTTTTYVPPDPSSLGLVAADPALHTKIVAPPTAVAGQSFIVTLVVTNTSTRTVDLNDAHGCQPTIAVAVANATVQPDFGAFSDVCYFHPLLIPPGTTRLPPVTVLTSDLGSGGCSGPDTQELPPISIPPCSPNWPPPLPAGRYALVLGGQEVPLPQAPTVYVTLVHGR